MGATTDDGLARPEIQLLMAYTNGSDVLRALHEAGHVIVGQRLNLHDGHGFESVTINVDGGSGGKTKMRMWDQHKIERLSDFVCYCCAGMAANALFGDESLAKATAEGGQDDMRLANEALQSAGKLDEAQEIFMREYHRAGQIPAPERLLLRWIASFLLHHRTIYHGTVHMLFRAVDSGEENRYACLQIAAHYQLPEHQTLSLEEFHACCEGVTASDLPECPVVLLDDVKLSATESSEK